MSYILEALKKAEERRQQGAPPRTVGQRVMTASSAPLSRGLMWLLILAVPLALAGGWWLRGVPEELTAKVAPAPEPVREVPAASAVPRPAEPVQLVEPAGSVESVEQVTPPAVAAAPPVPEVEEKVETVTLSSAEIPQVVDLPEPAPKPLPRYRDLSPALRGQLPPLTLSMHFYIEDPQRRLVRINDQLLHEGDWAAEDVLIAEIVESGVVLDFSGRLFELRRVGQ